MAAGEGWLQNRQPLILTIGISVAVWVLLLAAVIIGGPPSGRPSRPPAPPVTVPFDQSLRTGSSDLPLDQPPLVKQVGEFEPDQIHITLAGYDGMRISWATHDATILPDSEPVNPPDLNSISSVVQWGLETGQYQYTAEGNRTSYSNVYPNATYVSGIFHHVKLSGLAPNTTYYYRCGDPDKAWSSELSFKTLPTSGPNSFPQKIGIIGDLGQSYNSSSTLQHLIANKLPVVVLVGDFTYADNYFFNGSRRRGPVEFPFQPTYQPRWDAWGRFAAQSAAEVPWVGLHGNHEIELDAAGNTFQSYVARYQFAFNESNSQSPHYFSYDLGGAHIIHLGQYIDYDPGSPQYEWLLADLAAFSRERTPWLIVNFHAPWYNTYIAHYKEVECHREVIEPILYSAGVDLVFTGHVHAYERFNRVVNYELDPCAPMYVTIGDAGNIEGLYTSWVDDNPASCPDSSMYACPSFQDGKFCPTEQPPWSAYRNPSFGHGILEFESPTQARWQWHRNQDGVAEIADDFKIVRNPRCLNQQQE